jgi:DNA polymerase III sliding clamp (beta) subunit (PCNA family)
LVGKKASSADLKAFPAENLLEIFNNPSETSANISRSELAAVIDRIGLFTNPYEQNKVTVTFTKDSVSLNSEETESNESTSYVGGPLSVDIEPVVIDVNAQELKEIVNACTAEQIKIYFDEQKVMLVLDGAKILLGSVAVE